LRLLHDLVSLGYELVGLLLELLGCDRLVFHKRNVSGVWHVGGLLLLHGYCLDRLGCRG